MSNDGHTTRLALAREVLDGLSVGDAIGEALSYRCYRAHELADFSMMGAGTVCCTDDTEMAIGIYETLGLLRTVEEDHLAWAFSSRFRRDPERGYGKMARRILMEISAGADWREVSSTAFGGGGSFGNGAAMRVAPLGAYFWDKPDLLPDLAARSARVTHFHPEGIAGAVAVAVSTAAAVASRGLAQREAAEAVWNIALSHTPESRVRTRIALAREMPEASAGEVARALGNGFEVSAQDTVPFCLWNACHNLDDYREAILSTIEVDGDCDTNCAIVGGMVAAYRGTAGIPGDWLRVREALHIRS